jgi:23S rRNA pseudouridine2605 synthase
MSKAPASPGQRVQLHRAVSKLGWGSRSQAWEWIRARQVRVDGRVVTDPLAWVDWGRQRITMAGREAKPARPITLVLHKPRGIVTTRRDERGRRTVYDLLPVEAPWVFPVGRLDADSEGMLVLTNDSSLAARLTEPEHRVPKVYHVTIRGTPAPQTVDRLRRGLRLADGPTRPADVRVLEERSDDTVVEMILREGRNRQIRRMWSAVGHKVRRLVRVAIGKLELEDLAPGACRQLTPAAIRRLTEH